MSKKESNVVDLVLQDRGDKKATFKIVPKPTQSYGCRHMNCEVDEHTRTATCNQCGKAVDPFDWMLTAAVEERNIYYDALSVDAETKNKRKAIEELKRIERNYKSRIANARNKIGDTLIDDIFKSISLLQTRDMRERIEVGNVLTILKKLVSIEEPPEHTSLKAQNGLFPDTKIVDLT